jgi:hypothetical protein
MAETDSLHIDAKVMTVAQLLLKFLSSGVITHSELAWITLHQNCSTG